jgi:antirestriction protein
MEVRGYVANLGKYNEGQLVGEWVTFPVDEDEWNETLERIGISDEPDENGRIYEEFFFADWDCGCDFGFGEYEDVERVNEIAESADNLNSFEEEALEAMIDCIFGPEEALDKIADGEVLFYSDCDTMEDVAYRVVEETGMLANVDDSIAGYFDYEKYGRDLEMEGTFIPTETGYIEVIG